MNDDQKLRIVKNAKIRARKLQKLRQDQRYKNVIGRLVFDGLLDVKSVTPRNCKLHLEDMLWVGENVEPRVLELLPAILLKAPGTVYKTKLPKDLQRIQRQLKRGMVQGYLRGVPVKSCDKWIPKVGRKGARPTVPVTFRLSLDDIDTIKSISEKEVISQAAVIRRALSLLSGD